MAGPTRPMSTDTRAVSPVIGTVLLVLVTVLVVAVAGVTFADASESAPTPSAPTAIAADADPSGTITLTHEGGAPIDLSEASLRIQVNGESLAEQPPVPFFSASGFEPGPTGPFNAASDSRWTVGETGTLTVAGTNDPTLEEGATVVVRVVRDGQVLSRSATSVLGDGGDGDEG